MYFFVLPLWLWQLLPEESCFQNCQSVHLQICPVNASRQFLGAKIHLDSMVRFWLSKIKVTVTSQKMFLATIQELIHKLWQIFRSIEEMGSNVILYTKGQLQGDIKFCKNLFLAVIHHNNSVTEGETVIRFPVTWLTGRSLQPWGSNSSFTRFPFFFIYSLFQAHQPLSLHSRG